MVKSKKLSENLRKIKIKETVGNDFAKHLIIANSSRDVRAILNLMISNLIKEKAVKNISIDDYISFFDKIPTHLWATKPVFYSKDDKYDALGFLGEKVHAFTLISKTLDLYFSDGLNINLTDILDNKELKFIEIKNPKERIIKALEYLKENTTQRDLNRAFRKSLKIIHGGFY